MCMLVRIQKHQNFRFSKLVFSDIFESYSSPPPTFYISVDQLGLTEHFTYLGSIITSRCVLTAEIQHCVNLASASFGRLSNRVFTNRDLSARTKMAVYNAICVSTLLYACEGWTPYCRHIRPLEAFHIWCLQTILHVHWWDKIPHAEICRRAGTPCLETILLRRQLRWLGNVIRMPGNRLPCRLFYSEFSCGRRSVGGQKKRFKDHIKSSLSKCAIPCDRLEELAGDREEWHAVCDKGLATFEQQHIDVAVANGMRGHQQRNQPPRTTTCTDPPVPYVAVFALRTEEPHAPTQGNALSSVIVEPTDS